MVSNTSFWLPWVSNMHVVHTYIYIQVNTQTKTQSCWPYKHEDQSSDHQGSQKRPGASPYNSTTVKAQTGEPWGSLASQSKIKSSRFRERPCVKKIHQRRRQVTLTSHLHVDTCKCIETHAGVVAYVYNSSTWVLRQEKGGKLCNYRLTRAM